MPQPVLKTALLFCFAVLLTFLCGAQQSVVYNPFENDSLQQSAVLKSIQQKFIADSIALDGENKKDFRALYSRRFTSIKELFTDEEIITDADVTDYIHSIVEEILKGNPRLRSFNPHILVSRSSWPNAYCFGEGTIVVNIGLLYRLKNEAQLAFALCHELTHLQLDHSNKRIAQYVTTINSKEYQQELKRIQKSEYQKRQQAELLAKNIVLRGRRHSREDETSADAGALELLKNTRFDITQIITTLELLDSIDEELSGTALQLETQFNFTAYPFQKKWIEKTSSFFSQAAADTKTTNETDSLKTHPDCKKRIQLIQPKIAQTESGNRLQFVISEAVFNRLKQLYRFEIIEYCYNSGSISEALYYSLLLLQEQPDNLYLITVTGKCLHEIFTAQQNHTLNRICDLPNNSFGEQYNSLLRFIQQARLSDFGAISYYFLLPYEEKGKTNEEFLYALIHSKSNYRKTEEKSKWTTHYIQYFNQRKYSF